MRVLEDIFEMGAGYVLNFSDRTMGDFFYHELSIDIDDEKYRRFGHSKAKRLRCFLYTENPGVVVKTLRALWDYRDAIKGPFGEDDEKERILKERFFEIVRGIEVGGEVIRTDVIEKFEQSQTLEELISAIERDIQANKPQAALDRLHT